MPRAQDDDLKAMLAEALWHPALEVCEYCEETFRGLQSTHARGCRGRARNNIRRLRRRQAVARKRIAVAAPAPKPYAYDTASPIIPLLEDCVVSLPLEIVEAVVVEGMTNWLWMHLLLSAALPNGGRGVSDRVLDPFFSPSRKARTIRQAIQKGLLRKNPRRPHVVFIVNLSKVRAAMGVEHVSEFVAIPLAMLLRPKERRAIFGMLAASSRYSGQRVAVASIARFCGVHPRTVRRWARALKWNKHAHFVTVRPLPNDFMARLSVIREETKGPKSQNRRLGGRLHIACVDGKEVLQEQVPNSYQEIALHQRRKAALRRCNRLAPHDPQGRSVCRRPRAGRPGRPSHPQVSVRQELSGRWQVPGTRLSVKTAWVQRYRERMRRVRPTRRRPADEAAWDDADEFLARSRVVPSAPLSP